jgi:hypothetical protein
MILLTRFAQYICTYTYKALNKCCTSFVTEELERWLMDMTESLGENVEKLLPIFC